MYLHGHGHGQDHLDAGFSEAERGHHLLAQSWAKTQNFWTPAFLLQIWHQTRPAMQNCLPCLRSMERFWVSMIDRPNPLAVFFIVLLWITISCINSIIFNKNNVCTYLIQVLLYCPPREHQGEGLHSVFQTFAENAFLYLGMIVNAIVYVRLRWCVC